MVGEFRYNSLSATNEMLYTMRWQIWSGTIDYLLIRFLPKTSKDLPKITHIILLQIPVSRDLCVDVEFYREYFVGVVQAVPVKVYDYYEPGQSCYLKGNLHSYDNLTLNCLK